MESIEVYKPAGTVEEDFVNLVKLELNDIRNTFFKIGFRLNEANNNRYYKKLGFNSIEECAEALFGFGRTTTYDLMCVASRFCDVKAPMTLAEQYKKYNQSQLVLFTNLKFNSKEFIRMVDPNDSIQKLRKAKRYWDKCSRGAYGYNAVRGYMGCKTIDEFIEFIESRTSEGKPVETDRLSEKDFKTLDNIIDNKNVQMSGLDDKEKSPDIRTEQNDVIEISEGDYEDKTEEPSEDLQCIDPNRLHQDVQDYLTQKLELMGYKFAWESDPKKPAIRVLPSSMVDFVLYKILSFIDENRTEVKHFLQNAIVDKANSFDYQITLCGRKQHINAFSGNAANWILDSLLKDYLEKQEELKNKRKR